MNCKRKWSKKHENGESALGSKTSEGFAGLNAFLVRSLLAISSARVRE